MGVVDFGGNVASDSNESWVRVFNFRDSDERLRIMFANVTPRIKKLDDELMRRLS